MMREGPIETKYEISRALRFSVSRFTLEAERYRYATFEGKEQCGGIIRTTTLYIEWISSDKKIFKILSCESLFSTQRGIRYLEYVDPRRRITIKSHNKHNRSRIDVFRNDSKTSK